MSQEAPNGRVSLGRLAFDFYRGVNKIKIGFWGHYTISIVRNHQNSIGSYLGPYSMFQEGGTTSVTER